MAGEFSPSTHVMYTSYYNLVAFWDKTRINRLALIRSSTAILTPQPKLLKRLGTMPKTQPNISGWKWSTAVHHQIFFRPHKRF